MLAAPSSVTAARGPATPAAQPGIVGGLNRKSQTFQAHLRPERHLSPSPNSADARQESAAEGTARGGGEIVARPRLEDDPSASLAPDEQPSMARGFGGEPAELFSWLYPGAEPAPQPLQADAPPAGVAELGGLLERWVRRIALGGDPRRGVAKLDIGHGRFAGAELWIVAEAGSVSVELSLPRAGDSDLAQRLRRRLERRGYTADVVVR